MAGEWAHDYHEGDGRAQGTGEHKDGDIYILYKDGDICILVRTVSFDDSRGRTVTAIIIFKCTGSGMTSLSGPRHPMKLSSAKSSGLQEWAQRSSRAGGSQPVYISKQKSSSTAKLLFQPTCKGTPRYA